MGLFTDASAGYPQDVTQQNQFYNALTGVAGYYLTGLGTALAPPYLTSFSALNGSADQWYLQTNNVGDSSYRLLFYQQGAAGNYGAIAVGNGSTYQATLGALSSGWNCGQGITAAAGLSVNSTWHATGWSNSGTLAVSGTLTVGNYIAAPSTVGIAAGGTWQTSNSNNFLSLSDDNAAGNMILQANGTSRGLLFQNIDSSGATHNAFRARDTGQFDALGPWGFKYGDQNLNRFSFGHSNLPSSGSGYMTGTISHGLGATPRYLVMTLGDGGAYTGTPIYGYDRLGSSTFTGWASASGTVYCTFSAIA